MKRDELILRLKSLKDRLSNLQRELHGISGDFVSRRAIMDKALDISSDWFQQIEPSMFLIGFSETEISNYHEKFDSLLKISNAKNSRKSTFIRVVQSILSTFVNDLLVQVYKSTDAYSVPNSLSKIISTATAEEQEYLQEAYDCLTKGYLRAAVILGWCAAIDRMQRKIERLGFEEFNMKSIEMSNKTSGRYKRFNKKFEISTLNELRSVVFDRDLLWVLEYWGLIDSNQHERLSACYVMRNTSAHPGEALVSEENIASFFSDLKNYVFGNQNFEMEQ